MLADKPMTLNDLGAKHGISRERIRQLQVRLMDKLREHLKDNIPDFEGLFAGLVNGE
jgi:RNA polymerase sigma-32 factor